MEYKILKIFEKNKSSFYFPQIVRQYCLCIFEALFSAKKWLDYFVVLAPQIIVRVHFTPFWRTAN